MTVSIGGHEPMALPASLRIRCEQVRDELRAVIVALRQGETAMGKTLVAVQDTAARIRSFARLPRVAPCLYELIEEVVCSDIRNTFDAGLQRRMSSREFVDFIGGFFCSNTAITRVVQFCVQSVEIAFGSRSRLIPLQKLQFVAMLPAFLRFKDRLRQVILRSVRELRDTDDNQRSTTVCWAIRFYREMLREVDENGEIYGLTRTEVGSPQSGHTYASQEDAFVDSIVLDAVRYYRPVIAAHLSQFRGELLRYAVWAGTQIKREQSIFNAIGMSEKWTRLENILRPLLVRGRFVSMLEDPRVGLVAIIENNDEMSRVFELLLMARGPNDEPEGITIIANAYRACLKRQLLERFDELKEASECFPRDRAADEAEHGAFKALLATALRHWTEVIPFGFKKHSTLVRVWFDALSAILNESKHVPRLLSDHMDVYLAGAASSSDDEETVGLMLEFFKSVFVCVAQKDEFFANYRASLARRLLRGQFRRTTESQMLSRLKVVSGNAEVYPLNAMVSDIDNSDRLSSDMLGGASMESFLAKEKLKARTILVTAQYWPTFAYMDMRPAPVMSSFITLFEAFYQNRFPNRRIRWVYQSSTGVVNARFTNGPKELSGTLIQSTVLLTIDGTAGMRIPALVEATGLAKESVADAVASMYMNKKVNVLECIDPSSKAVVDTKRITDGLVFRMNLGFRSPVRKLDLPKPRTAKGVDMGQIEALRKVLADVAIVRFMKSRGSAMFAELVDATLADLRRKFDAQPPLVKKQLEGLIDKGMVRRDADDPKRLIYVA